MTGGGLREIPPPVSESDPRGLRELPKGQLDEGQLYLKDDDDRPIQGDSPIAKTDPKFSENCQSSVILNFDDFEWPIKLPKKPLILSVLKRLQDNKARQEALDIFAQKSEKEPIRYPKKLLEKIVDNVYKDDYTPAQKTSKILERFKQSEKQAKEEAIKNCPYCDENGYISYIGHDEKIYGNPQCSHNHNKSNINWNFYKKVTSAKPGYRTKEDSHSVTSTAQTTNITSCPYCNDKGQLILLDEDNNTDTRKCNHGPIKLNRLGKSNCGYDYVKILSAQPDYQTPGNTGLTSVSQLLDDFDFNISESERLFHNPDYNNNNQENDWEVPF